MSVELKDILKTLLSEDTSPDTASDAVMTYDASADALKKVKLENLGSSGNTPGSMALEFDGPNPPGTGGHVTTGLIWQPSTDYSNSAFFCEAWLKPMTGLSTGYWAIQGSGGRHIVMLGGNDTAGRADLNTQISNGTLSDNIESSDTTPTNGWVHHAAAYIPDGFFAVGTPNGNALYLWINGILTAFKEGIADMRATGTNTSGSNQFELGGTDHNNWLGRMAQIRFWEGNLPFATAPNGFMPEKSFRGGMVLVGTSLIPVNFLMDLRNNTGGMVPDHGIGFNGSTHPGVLSAGYTPGSIWSGFDNFDGTYPKWVIDPITKPVETISAPTIPGSAILYDSFTRADITPAFDAQYDAGNFKLNIGTLETGQTWLGEFKSLAIINRRLASTHAAPNTVTTYAEAGTANMDVRITTGDSTHLTMPGIIYARYTDASNYCRLLVNVNGTVEFDEVVAGSITHTGSWALAGSPTVNTLRINILGATAKIYQDATLLGTVGSLTAAGTKAGFRFQNGLGRISTFEVYPAT